MPNKTVSIAECRTLLGASAVDKSDAQIELWRDELTGVANTMYDHLQSKVRAKYDTSSLPLSEFGADATAAEQKHAALERIRWIAHAHLHGDEDLTPLDSGEPTDAERWLALIRENPDEKDLI